MSRVAVEPGMPVTPHDKGPHVDGTRRQPDPWIVGEHGPDMPGNGRHELRRGQNGRQPEDAGDGEYGIPANAGIDQPLLEQGGSGALADGHVAQSRELTSRERSPHVWMGGADEAYPVLAVQRLSEESRF